MARYCHTYQSVPESEGQMLDELQSILTTHKITEDAANAVMLTASEAYTNALVHGNCYDPKKTITLEVEIAATQLMVGVTDEGKGGAGFSRGRLTPEPLAESGRGIGLMKHYAQRVKFSSTLSGGLKVTAIFNRDREYKASSHN